MGDKCVAHGCGRAHIKLIEQVRHFVEERRVRAWSCFAQAVLHVVIARHEVDGQAVRTTLEHPGAQGVEGIAHGEEVRVPFVYVVAAEHDAPAAELLDRRVHAFEDGFLLAVHIADDERTFRLRIAAALHALFVCTVIVAFRVLDALCHASSFLPRYLLLYQYHVVRTKSETDAGDAASAPRTRETRKVYGARGIRSWSTRAHAGSTAKAP